MTPSIWPPDPQSESSGTASQGHEPYDNNALHLDLHIPYIESADGVSSSLFDLAARPGDLEAPYRHVTIRKICRLEILVMKT